MGRYERMICYLYEYQDGHKGANVGYVKLEKRGEQCRVLIQMRRAEPCHSATGSIVSAGKNRRAANTHWRHER